MAAVLRFIPSAARCHALLFEEKVQREDEVHIDGLHLTQLYGSNLSPTR